MAPNEHEFHESDEKFLAPGAATSSNTALQRGWLVSNRWAVPASTHASRLTFPPSPFIIPRSVNLKMRLCPFPWACY